MDDTKRLLERAGRLAPTPEFRLDDVRDRRRERDHRRRVSATIVGLGITVLIVAGAVAAVPSIRGHGTIKQQQAGGAGLPAPTRSVALGPGEFSYQRIKIEADFACATCGSQHVELLAQSWWALDGSGRIDVSKAQNYGIRGGTFGPGTFPTEGDLTGFPTDPEALRRFLLERSAENGASPRPDVTPAPGVSLEDGQLWLAIRDYLGSTQYLNATPELRAAMLQVLAEDPMVAVSNGVTDPLGRPASSLQFHAYDQDVSVFVEPTTGDFMAMTARVDDASSGSVIVEQAGIATSDQVMPRGGQITVPEAQTSSSSAPTSVPADFVVGGAPRDTVKLGWLPAGFEKRSDTVQTYTNGAEIHSTKYSDGSAAIDIDAMRRPEGLDPRGDFFFPMQIDHISIGGHDVLVVTPTDPNGDLSAVEWQEGPVTVRLVGNHVDAQTLVHVAENATLLADLESAAPSAAQPPPG